MSIPRKKIVALILRHEGKVLISNHDKKIFPGGYVNEGENLHEAIKRHGQEHLQIKIIGPKLVYTADFDGEGEPQTIHWFGCTTFEGQIIPREDVLWIDPEKEVHILSYDVTRMALIKFLLDSGK